MWWIDGSGDVNEVAIAHYNNVIDDVLAKGKRIYRHPHKKCGAM
jgi:beta-glucosidase/6-phospho-beta-glucosidase/beta-galactosidase